MNGGGGGYHRPSGSSGSGEDDADDEDPSSVPAPDPDPDEESADPPIDEPDSDSEETNEKPGDTPGSPPPTGSGGGSGSGGVPPTDPGIGGPEDDNNDPPEEPEDGSHEPAEESSQNEDQDDTNQDDLEDSEEHEPEEEEEDDEESEEEEDEECLLTESAQLHSPNPDALDTVTEGDIYSVQLRDQSVCIIDEDDQTIGAIAEPWVDTIKSCLRDGWQYRAHILELDGGYCEVRVTNKCRLNQQIALNSVNSAITSNLHPGQLLPVENTDQSEIFVTTDGSRVGTVPEPWAGLLSDCITQGHACHAEVVDVMPDHCQVIIQNGPSNE